MDNQEKKGFTGKLFHNKEGLKAWGELFCAAYLVLMFAVYPFYMERGYVDIGEAKYRFFIYCSLAALAILGHPQEAEDAVQNAFMQVIRHFEKIYQIPCEELPYWLISIVKSEARMILRKKERAVPLEESWEAVDARAGDVSDYTALVELFASLPEYRQVLEMKALLGYTDREIARKLGISETAVSTRASRGRALLREILE